VTILVGGEALYDLVARDERTIAAHPGGGPFNTARTIARLDQPVAYLGRLSTDRFGRQLERLLADEGVDLGPVIHTDEPTTLALAEVDEQGAASYRFYAEGTAAAGLTPQDALARLPAGGVDVLHVGTLGLTFEPVADALEAVVERLAATAVVAVDPNVRPGAIADEAAYRARLDRVLGRAHLVKVSVEDLDWLEPGLDWRDAARGLLARGPAAVLVTRGAQGAVAITADGSETAVEAPAVKVVDTIGAGDAFGGGFLAWWRSHGLGAGELRDHDGVVEGASFAARVAALTCARPGAWPPRLAELAGRPRT
jgi:fructokinase